MAIGHVNGNWKGTGRTRLELLPDNNQRFDAFRREFEAAREALQIMDPDGWHDWYLEQIKRHDEPMLDAMKRRVSELVEQLR